MIFVTLGTQKEPFTRLLDYIEESHINRKIIVQSGYTKYTSTKMQILDFITPEQMQDYIQKADIIITHGGTGSILTSLKANKKIIACARLKKYGEHVDDHQKELIKTFVKEHYILELNDHDNLDDILKQIKRFKPQKYHSNIPSFIKHLKAEIES